jgi:hypothetical protein
MPEVQYVDYDTRGSRITFDGHALFCMSHPPDQDELEQAAKEGDEIGTIEITDGEITDTF